MSRVAVVAAGMTSFGVTEKTIPETFADAFADAAASADKGLLARDVEEAWIGSLGFGGAQLGNLGALLVHEVGATGVPSRRVENACASSGFALRDAYHAVKSGSVDVALVGGVERMNDLPGIQKRYWLGVSGDTPWERAHGGLTFPGVYALVAARHMKEHGTTRDHLADVAVKNHANGALNPKAQFQKAITKEKALASPMVAAPLGLFDCCSTTDGAAVVVLASEDAAKRFTDTPVWVTGSGAATDPLAVHERPTITSFQASARAARDAFKRAGVGPGDVDVAEVHDCFTIAELLALEDIGFCAPGQGGPFTASGATAIKGGTVAVNPSGGLKAKGHPLGATGAGQVVEVFKQLRGEAGGRQVADAEVALAHNVGGSGATCTVHVFSR